MNMNMIWAAAIDGWLVSLRAGGARETTIRTRRQHVTQLATSGIRADPWAVTADDLVAYMGRHTWALETRYSHRSSLRSFYGWGRHHGLTEADPARELPKVRRTPPRPRPLPEVHAVAALAAADERTALMIRLAGEHGLRRAEIAVVHSNDVVEDLLGFSLVVHGKGGRDRQVPCAEDVARVILAADGWVFPGKLDGHISPWWVGKLVGRVLPHGFTTHTLRHRFATTAYGADHDVFAVQAFLGHASPQTTLRYVQLPDDAQRKLLAAAGIGGNVIPLRPRRTNPA